MTPSANYHGCMILPPSPFSASGLLYSSNNLLSGLVQELGGEACLDGTGSSCKAEVTAALTVPGNPAAWTRWDKRAGMVRVIS